MSILVANIGTSDICVKINDHYFPIGFDREERNLQFPEPGSLEAKLWERRTILVREMAQTELGMDLIKLNEFQLPSFRFITEALFTAYQQDPENWHPRIQISRIWGVIKSALDANPQVKQLHLVVTDQPSTETRGYPLDTIHAFAIIQGASIGWGSRG
jgi:hypothetical protein